MGVMLPVQPMDGDTSQRKGDAMKVLFVAGFCVAAVLGLYMIWKIIRTPGEL